MNPEALWIGLGLMLIFEGLMPMVAPRKWRELFSQIAALRDGQIRFMGVGAVLVGLFFLSI